MAVEIQTFLLFFGFIKMVTHILIKTECKLESILKKNIVEDMLIIFAQNL